MKKLFSLVFLAAMIGAVAGLWLLINVVPHWAPNILLQTARQKDLLEAPRARRCGECHKEIFQAWEKSRHHVAWNSETYVKDSENRTKEKCLPCHIPQRVVAGDKPEPRLTQREEGVFCVSCHLTDGAMNGPYELLSPPHPTRKKEEYRSAKFCGTCHEKTYKEWTASGAVTPCQDCHMPRRLGRLTQKFPLSLLHRQREVADHRFLHGEFAAADLEFRATISGGKLRVALLNRKIPHRVPTADNGDPRLYLVVTQYGPDNAEPERTREILAPQQDTALAFGKETAFDYALNPSTLRTEVLLQYKPAWSKDKTVIRSWSSAPANGGKP
jgi:hypothetical protein